MGKALSSLCLLQPPHHLHLPFHCHVATCQLIAVAEGICCFHVCYLKTTHTFRSLTLSLLSCALALLQRYSTHILTHPPFPHNAPCSPFPHCSLSPSFFLPCPASVMSYIYFVYCTMNLSSPLHYVLIHHLTML